MKTFITTLFIFLFLLPSLNRAEVLKEKYPQLTKIPTVYIETFDGGSITSKTEYKYCRLIRIDSSNTEFFDSVSIRGRGNASWGFAKKPYRIKFAHKERFLGKDFANAKNWTLLSNDGGKIMMQNGLASFVGKLTGLPFNAACKFVDFYLNGEYLGTYQISDQIEVKKHRVEIEEQDTMVTSPLTNITGGYLMEQDGYTDADATYFTTPNGGHIRVHSPDNDVINSKQYNYIKNFLATVENNLFSNNYLNSREGYLQYFDSTTLVGWYLASEIVANMDIFHSTYFYKHRDNNHLYLGPLWDNDLSFNNAINFGDQTKVLMANQAYGYSQWFQRIRTDPWFNKVCAQHFCRLYEGGLDSLMLHYMDSVLDEIRPSVDLNYKRWKIWQLYNQDYYIYTTYDAVLEHVREFIVEHNAFLYRTFKHHDPSILSLKPDCNYLITCKRATTTLIGVSDSTATQTQACLRSRVDGQLAQQWTIEADGPYFTICNALSGLALSDLEDDQGAFDVAPLQKGNSAQLWELIPRTEGYYNLKNVASEMILTNHAAMTNDGNLLFGRAPSSVDSTSLDRLWRLESVQKHSDIPSKVLSAEAATDYALAVNAATHKLHFVTENLSNLIFKAYIYDLQGRYRGSFRADEEFDLNKLSGGTYLVSWQFAGQCHSAKFYYTK